MCEVIHEFGSLAGAAIHRAGQMAANRFSRKIPLAHSHRPIATYDPVQVRAMGLFRYPKFKEVAPQGGSTSDTCRL